MMRSDLTEAAAHGAMVLRDIYQVILTHTLPQGSRSTCRTTLT